MQLIKSASISQPGIESDIFNHGLDCIGQNLEPSLTQEIVNQINISLNAQLPNLVSVETEKGTWILDRNNFTREQEAFYQVELALNNQDYSAALSRLEQCLKLKYPPQQKYTLLVMAGISSTQLKHYDKAIQFLNKAILLNPMDPLAHKFFSFVYLLKGIQTQDKNLLKKALNLIEKNASVNLNTLDNHFLIGYIQSQLGDWLNAIKEYEVSLEINPNFHQAKIHLLLAYIHLAQNSWDLEQEGFFDKAINLIEKFTPQVPAIIYFYNYLSSYLLEYKYYQKALKILKKALEQSPDSFLTQMQLGRCHLLMQNFSPAKTLFKKLVTMDEGEIVKAIKKDIPEADIDISLIYSEIWHQYGVSIVSLYKEGISKSASNKKELSILIEAEVTFKRSLSYNLEQTASRLGLGAVYSYQKKWVASGKEFLSILNSEPDNQDAKENLDELRQTISKIIYDAFRKRVKRFTKSGTKFPVSLAVEAIIETRAKLLLDADSETAEQIYGSHDLAQVVSVITEQLQPISAVRDLVFDLYLAGLLTLVDAARLAKLTTAEFLSNILGPVEINKEHLPFVPAELDRKDAIELLQSWQKEKPAQEDDESWQIDKEEFDKNRFSTRKLFV